MLFLFFLVDAVSVDGLSTSLPMNSLFSMAHKISLVHISLSDIYALSYTILCFVFFFWRLSE